MNSDKIVPPSKHVCSPRAHLISLLGDEPPLKDEAVAVVELGVKNAQDADAPEVIVSSFRERLWLTPIRR